MPNSGATLPHGQGVLAGPPLATRREFAAAAAATAAAAALAAPRIAAAAQDDGATGSSPADPAGPADSADSGGPAQESGKGASPSASEGAASDGAVSEAAEASSAADTSSSSASADDVQTTDVLSFEDRSDTLEYQPSAIYSLSLGSMPCMRGDRYAAVLRPNQVARPLTVVDCLDIQTGQVTSLLDAPMAGDGFSPSDCVMTDRLLAWVETDNSTDEWRLYAAPHASGSLDLSDAVMLDQGDADWLPPQLDAWERTVVWQHMPDPTGPYVTNSSLAYLWRLGDQDASVAWESPGRFACAPNLNAGMLTLAPRVNSDQGVYYGVTSVDLDGMEVVDQLVLPVSVRPFMATTIGDDLAFSIEADYGYGGTFGSMGTYIGPSQGPFLALRREPSAQVNCVNGLYILRSQLSYFVVDPIRKVFTRILAASNCVDYGDYPVTSGTCGQFVTYAMVKDEDTGVPSQVLTRIFTLI